MRTKRSFPAPVAVVVLVVAAMVLAACGSGTTADAPPREAAAEDTYGVKNSAFPGWNADDPGKVVDWNYAPAPFGSDISCSRGPEPPSGPETFKLRGEDGGLLSIPLSAEALDAKSIPDYPLFWPATAAAPVGQNVAGIRGLRFVTNQDGLRDWNGKLDATLLPYEYFTSNAPGYRCQDGDKKTYLGVMPDAYAEDAGEWSFAGDKLGYGGSIYHEPFVVWDPRTPSKCMDRADGTSKIRAWDCNNTNMQQFIARADGSISPISAPDQCLNRISDTDPVDLVKCVSHPVLKTAGTYWGLAPDRLFWKGRGADDCLSTKTYPQNDTPFKVQLGCTDANDLDAIWLISSYPPSRDKVPGTKVSAGCKEQTDTTLACQVTKLASGDDRRVGLVGAYNWTLPVRLTVNNNTNSMMVINSAPSTGGSSGTITGGAVNLVPNDGMGEVRIPGEVEGKVSTGGIGFLRKFNLDSPKLSAYLKKNAEQSPDVPALSAVKDKPFRVKLNVILVVKNSLFDAGGGKDGGGQAAVDDCVAGKPSTPKVDATQYAKFCSRATITVTAGRDGVRADDAASASTQTSYNKVNFKLEYDKSSPAKSMGLCIEDDETTTVNVGSSARSLGPDGFMDLQLGLMECGSVGNPLVNKDAILNFN